MVWDYKVENLELLNMPTRKVGSGRGAWTKYEIEEELSLEEKIEFIDEGMDGFASYMLNIFEKFEVECETIKKDSYGGLHTNSLKAWLKRNDPKKIIDRDAYSIGTYRIFGVEYRFRSGKKCGRTTYGHDLPYTQMHIAHQWFHDLLKTLKGEEVKYFESIDEFSIKLKTLNNLVREHGGIEDITRYIELNGLRDIVKKMTLDDLNTLLSYYDEFIAYKIRLRKELNSKLTFTIDN